MTSKKEKKQKKSQISNKDIEIPEISNRYLFSDSSLANLSNHFLDPFSSFHRILCCDQGQAYFCPPHSLLCAKPDLLHTNLSIARLCPVATVTHEMTVIVEEETEEAARNLSLPPREKGQGHPSKGKRF